MFDLDALLADLVAAGAEVQPRLAVKEVLDRAMREPGAVADALPATQAELVTLHVSPELTVLKVVWAPGMHIPPHDHGTWASIGIYAGGEDNELFRRTDQGLQASGGVELRRADVCLLGDDTIHRVTNPTAEHTGAIHVYGGDFFAIPRSEWTDDSPHVESPYDATRTMQRFEDANRT